MEKDYIIPDCVRVAVEGRDIIVRNPYSIRPYQHVPEPLFAYLMVGAAQYENLQLTGVLCLDCSKLKTLFIVGNLIMDKDF